MKILVVGTGGSIVSGISTAADEMARTLEGLGHTVGRLHAGEQMRRHANAVNIENVTAALADALAVYRQSRRGRADVVWIHAMGVPTLPALRALAMVAAARASGHPAVMHYHAFGLERAVVGGGRPMRLAVRALTALASTSVVLHNGAAEALRSVRRGLSVQVLPNWVQVSESTAALAAPPPLRLVFVGGLVCRKGVPQLIEAMRALDDVAVELRLVGGAGEDGPAALQGLHAAAADLVRRGRVTFTGEQAPAGVRSELRRAHLLVLPSDAEGMPMAMLEAMAQERPVLVTDAGNMKSVVEETGCGWVLPDREPATIARCVRRISADPDGLSAASAAARRAAISRYSATAAGPGLAAVLASVGER